jgi:hypothetical protein
LVIGARTNNVDNERKIFVTTKSGNLSKKKKKVYALLPDFHPPNTWGLNGFELWPQLSNPEPDLRFGSAIFENLELNFRFSSGRFGFKPKFRTELVHH